MTRTRILVDLDKLHPNPWQPRVSMDPDHIEEMADSIERLKLLQLPLARPYNRAGEYELAHGHQRVESCKVVATRGKEINDWPVGKIEIDVEDLTDTEMALIALTENERRRDIPPLDLARAHRRAIDETGLKVAELAEKLGVARPTLQNNLRVLTLPDAVVDLVEDGRMSMSVAREFLPLRCKRGDHTDLMEEAISECGGEFTRVRVRGEIGWVVGHHDEWRRLTEDNCLFDIEAFKVEHKDSVHTTGEYHAADASVLRTCDADAWNRWQKDAQDERHAAALAPANPEGDGEPPAGDDQPDPRLSSILLDDPVWQGIVSLRSEAGPDLPQNDREREALGSRGRMWAMGPDHQFLKGVYIDENASSDYLEQMSDPRRWTAMPPWFPDLEECKSCTIGAAYGHWYGETLLACTNKEHWVEKLARGEAAYRERLQAARERHDEELIQRYEQLVDELMSMSPELVRMMLRGMTARDFRLIWRHPVGVYHQAWSDEGPITERVRMILQVPPTPHTGYQIYGYSDDVREKVAALSQEDAEQLLALLTVMRDMEDWTATPQELEVPRGTLQELSPELSAFLSGWTNDGWDGEIIADLYVCWDCGNHHLPVEPDVVAPDFHADCGGALEWSGHLLSYDPETGVIGRTWDEMPRPPEAQAEIHEDAYELVEA